MPCASCDHWTGTVLRNDLDHPVRSRLYYRTDGWKERLVLVQDDPGDPTPMWVGESKEGEVPVRHPPDLGMVDPDSLPMIEWSATERWLAAKACMERLPSGTNVLHWTLAPNGTLGMARALGRTAGTYLDPLVMEDGSTAYALYGVEAILGAVRMGRSEHRINASRIRVVGTPR